MEPRCWLATEDLKIGDKFRSRIQESIRVHDKLLLILSKPSLASPWVEDEVESALERERREHRLVLFPIRIDDAIMDTDVAWAAHLRQSPSQPAHFLADPPRPGQSPSRPQAAYSRNRGCPQVDWSWRDRLCSLI